MVFRTRDSAPGSHSSRPAAARLSRRSPRTAFGPAAPDRAAYAAALIRRAAVEALEERRLFATFTVTDAGNSGAGTLRQAILDANDSIGADQIVFDIGAGGAVTISPTSELPTITDPVLIDGTTQGLFNGAPIVELDGSNSSGDGFRITAGETTIRGMVINDWDWGITMSDEGGNIIAGNYIGTDITGTIDDGNSEGGILIEIGDNQIGGLGPDADDPDDDFLDANVISGNEGYGVRITGDGNVLVNNLIGVDVTGTIAIGNDDSGIRISSGDNLVGDLDERDRGNIIANNGGDGVEITGSGTGNAVLSNSIFANGEQGIDLGPDGVNNNDTAQLDADTGANDLQNYPILSAARFVGGNFTVEGTFTSTPGTTFRFQFFTGVDDDSNSDHGEGQTQLEALAVTLVDPLGTSDADVNIQALADGDELEVTTGSDGTVQFSVVLTGVPAGRHVTATATNLTTSDTSEFGLNVISGTTAGINVEGSGNVIVTGDLTPDPADNTDFGEVFLDDTDGVANTFVVRNTGSAAVALTGNPRVQISGVNAADFVVETQPSSVIDPGDDSNLVIRFIPGGAGLRTAIVTIPNTDPDENPYVFAIQGTGSLKQVSIDSVAVVEGNTGSTNAIFTVTLSAPAANDVVLSYTTAGGTATAGVDYTPAVAGVAVILAGSSTATISVPVLGDTVFEADETFVVTITTLDGTVSVLVPAGIGTILNDEVAPTLSVVDAQQAEGQTGLTEFLFTVTLDQVSTLNATVNFSTADGTALAGSDYTATSGVLTIPAGSLTGTVTVVVLGDRVLEPNETFVLNLSAPSLSTIADGQGVGTILNDDVTFTITPPDASGAGQGVVVETPGGLFAPFTVALSQVSTEVISVRFATQDGTATSSSDYTPAGGLLTFQPGETTKTVPVFVTADTLVEGDENFRLVLFQPTNAGLTGGDFPLTIRDSTLPFLTVDNRSPLTYTDANGDQVTVAIKGNGQANVVFADTSGVGNAVGVVVDGTSNGSSLSITSSGGGTSVGGINVNRNVKTITAPDVDLTGNLSTLGTVKGISFRSASGGGTANLFIRGNVAMGFGRVENYNIESDSNLKSLSVGEWLDTDGAADLIHAPGINALSSRGDFSADIVTGTIARANIGGALAGADFRPTVGIKQLSAGAIRDSNLFVGVSGSVDADRSLPATDADLFNDASFIRKLTTGSFSNSRIAANTLGTISLGSIQSENADRQLGTSADKITSVTGSTNRGAISYGKTDGPLNASEDDLLIRVY
jgi:hypothetical protein